MGLNNDSVRKAFTLRNRYDPFRVSIIKCQQEVELRFTHSRLDRKHLTTFTWAELAVSKGCGKPRHRDVAVSVMYGHTDVRCARCRPYSRSLIKETSASVLIVLAVEVKEGIWKYFGASQSFRIARIEICKMENGSQAATLI